MDYGQLMFPDHWSTKIVELKKFCAPGRVVCAFLELEEEFSRELYDSRAQSCGRRAEEAAVWVVTYPQIGPDNSSLIELTFHVIWPRLSQLLGFYLGVS